MIKIIPPKIKQKIKNQENPAIPKVLSKEPISNNTNNTKHVKDNLHVFKTLYGNNYEIFAKAFYNLNTKLKLNFEPNNLKEIREDSIISLSLKEFILHCLANPLFLTNDQAFADAYLTFAKLTLSSTLQQLNLLFLFCDSLCEFINRDLLYESMYASPEMYTVYDTHPTFINEHNQVLRRAHATLHNRLHNLKILDALNHFFKISFNNIDIKIPYKKDLSFNDVKKHYFFINKELIEFNNRFLTQLLLINNTVFCGALNLPLHGFYVFNENNELRDLNTRDWLKYFDDESLQKKFQNCILNKVSKTTKGNDIIAPVKEDSKSSSEIS